MVKQILLTIGTIVLLTGTVSPKAYAEESTMLKSRLHTQTSSQQSNSEKQSLLSMILNSTNIYDYLLGNPDFAKIQDMTIRLWDKHTNIRKYRTHMKDNFIYTD